MIQDAGFKTQDSGRRIQDGVNLLPMAIGITSCLLLLASYFLPSEH